MKPFIVRLTAVLLLLFTLILAGCQRPSDSTAIAVIPSVAPVSSVSLPATPTLASTRQPQPTAVLPTPTPTSTLTPTPFYTGESSTNCGQILPLLAENITLTTSRLTPDETAVARLEARLPDAARPAWERLLAAPDTVGLVAYRLGQEANGVSLNADVQMPLASVAKLIHLVAYAEAAGSGRLNPLSTVTVADLERYYLPGTDLGSHNRSLDDLAEQALVLSNPDRVRLEDVPWMMMRYSSNAATDYLHVLLGQTTIEETAVSLGLTAQTAPCPWVGQFLTMYNHLDAGESAILSDYLADPASYGRDVTQLTDAFSNDAAFRTAEIEWRRENRRPSGQARRFSHALNAHGTPREYAALMARLAQNGLSNPESSFLARRYLEWPMIFPANQELFTNLGYKNGSLPGILNTVYYAYPQDGSAPIVVVLFYRDLPSSTYRTWRNSLAHDEFARWLLADPEAIPLLQAVLESGL